MELSRLHQPAGSNEYAAERFLWAIAAACESQNGSAEQVQVLRTALARALLREGCVGTGREKSAKRSLPKACAPPYGSLR